MALVSVAERNRALDLYYGTGVPASFALALFNGDPANGGVEVTGTGGVARATVANDVATWPAAATGAKTSAPITFSTSTGAMSDTATWWVLFNGADMGDSRPLDTEVDVLAAGAVVSVRLTVNYEDPVI